MNILDFVSHWDIVKRFFRPRNAVKIIAIFLAVLSYHLVFEYKAPAENFLRRAFSTQDTIRLHSGAGGGFYVRMGRYLAIQDSTIKQSFIIKSIPTNGALDNLNRVLTQTNSLGFVNEITSPPGDYSRQQLNFICPLYMERLHIAYRKSSMQRILEAQQISYRAGEDKPVLKINPDRATLAFLNEAVINAGPHGSGTRLLASYFLNAIPEFEQRTFWTDSNKDAEKNFLKEKKYDIHFSVVGDPMDLFANLLADPDFGMISIDPALMSKVNATHDLNLRFADFKGKYDEEKVKQITTVGSYVNLVASEDVQTKDIINVLELLRRAQPEDLGVKAKTYQLSELDFAGVIDKLKTERTSLLQSGLLFLLSVSVTTIAIIWFLITAISKSKLSRYYRTITEIYQGHLIFKHDLTDGDNGLKVPRVQQTVAQRVNGLNEGFIRILEVIDQAFFDYKLGGITENDYKNLLKEFHTLHNDFQIGLERRLLHALKENYAIQLHQIDSYFYAGFLSREAHENLLTLLSQPSDRVGESI